MELLVCLLGIGNTTEREIAALTQEVQILTETVQAF